MAENDATMLTGIDLLRQRRDALLLSASTETQLAASAETRAADAAADPQTEFVAPIDYPSGALAWSEASGSDESARLWAEAPIYDDAAEPPVADGGRRPLSTGLVGLLASVLAAAVTLAAVLLIGHWQSPSPAHASHAASAAVAPAPTDALPAAPAAPPAAAPTAVPAPSAPPVPATQPHQQTDDEFFEQSITTGSVVPPIAGMDTARAQAHALCTYLDASPRTEHELYQYTVDVWPNWSARQRGAFAGSAINAYCGQYDNLPD